MSKDTSPISKSRRVVLLVVAALVLVLLVGWKLWSRSPTLTITFLDVGQGDSAVIQTPNGSVLIVDAGRAGQDDDMGRRVVAPFLRQRGIRDIDGLLLTHSDDDHIGGARTLMDRIRVRRLLLSNLPVTEDRLHLVIRKAKQTGVVLERVSAGQTLRFGDGVEIDVLHPAAGYKALDANNGSVTLHVRFGQTSFLLTGDADADAESKILSAYPYLKADVLKCGHHGSRTATSARLLDIVRPQIAVVSAGRRNLFGHPHPTVVERLEKRGIRILRTDKMGSITMSSDGRTIKSSVLLLSAPQ